MGTGWRLPAPELTKHTNGQPMTGTGRQTFAPRRWPALLLACGVLLAVALCGAYLGGSETARPDRFGVLVMSHGGGPEWNAVIESTVAPLRTGTPLELVWGMADATTMEAGIRRLEAAGVGRIGVVRLFVSGQSFLKETRQVLGLEPGAPPRPAELPKSSGGCPIHALLGSSGHADDKLRDAKELDEHLAGIPFYRIPTTARFALSTEGLSDSPLMAEVLAERVRAMSREPRNESVLVLAHGPADDAEDALWLRRLDELANATRALGTFRAVRVETLREDWPEKRVGAIARIREFVAQGNRDGGRVLVVPFRVNGFGPYAEVLKDLNYVSDGVGLAPHPKVTRWIEEQIRHCETELMGQNRQ